MACTEEMISNHEILIQTAFLATIASIRSRVLLRIIVERMEVGDVAGTFEATQTATTPRRPKSRG